MVKLNYASWLDQDEYIHWDRDLNFWAVNDDAPEEVKEESRLYWKQIEYYRKLEKETDANII